MRNLPRILLVSLTLMGCVGCDQVSKSAARAFLEPGVAHSLLAGSLRLQLVQNPGSFLSMGASLPQQFRFALFVALVGVMLAALVGVALFAGRLGRTRFTALALVAGGGISNLLDRVMFDGRVTDFLNVGVGPLRSGIFNLADMAILLGVALLLLKKEPPPGAAVRPAG